MVLRANFDAQQRLSPWQLHVCFMLAAFFLHNPFFTIYGSSPVLKVQHPLSYRGTVASSELRRSRVEEVQPRIFAPEEAVPEAVALFATLAGAIGVPRNEPLNFQPQTLSESLWFRPPPVS